MLLDKRQICGLREDLDAAVKAIELRDDRQSAGNWTERVPFVAPDDEHGWDWELDVTAS